MKKSLQEWLEDYGESHMNRTNVFIHKLCVPLIFVSIYFMLFSLKLPVEKSMYINWANFVYLFVLFFYFRLSFKLGFIFLVIGLVLSFLAFLAWIMWFYFSDNAMLRYSAIVFILAWVGQFIGHKIEGKKPSFLKDLQFLLIGPIWVFYRGTKLNK